MDLGFLPTPDLIAIARSFEDGAALARRTGRPALGSWYAEASADLMRELQRRKQRGPAAHRMRLERGELTDQELAELERACRESAKKALSAGAEAGAHFFARLGLFLAGDEDNPAPSSPAPAPPAQTPATAPEPALAEQQPAPAAPKTERPPAEAPSAPGIAPQRTRKPPRLH